jgi:hypothetical protein
VKKSALPLYELLPRRQHHHFNDFFSYVVDPEWLASNSEEARALRQARGKANKTWRVLHRVTYVERPA